jgi:DNA mismatch repair protein MutS
MRANRPCPGKMTPIRRRNESYSKTPPGFSRPTVGDAIPHGGGGTVTPQLSILFDRLAAGGEIHEEPPEFFTDLNLDQIVEAIVAGRAEYNLKPFFYMPLSCVETIEYRQEIFKDLENPVLAGLIHSFAHEMREMRSNLAHAEKFYYHREKQAWFLDAVDGYCAAVTCLARDLTGSVSHSRGLAACREYLTRYAASDSFVSLLSETQQLKAGLSQIQYSLHIQGNRVNVTKYESESDYSAEVLETFEKFKHGSSKEYRFEFPSYPEMNHVEAAIADLLAELYPEIFSALEGFYDRRRAYLDPTIAAFDREVQFYLATLEHIERFKAAGLRFCYPVVGESKEIRGNDTFDLALAAKLVTENGSVVTNDFYLRDPERILVISGPNQGGKTTFARMFGQLHYLAALGLPVSGSEAALFLCDRLSTHFEREEDIQNLSGKLEDDLLRIHRILEAATPKSILIMNESFLSTTLNDALFLSKEILQRVMKLDMLCVSVTFLDELASLSEATVSMVSTVDPEDPATRTFKIIRRPADGLAYAAAIAEKYRLTYDQVKNRIVLSANRGVAP